MKPKTHTEAVRQIAKRYGHNRRNQFYISKCLELFDLDISSSTISRAIGRYQDRMFRAFPNDGPSKAELSAKKLLKSTDGDVVVAHKILDSVATP